MDKCDDISTPHHSLLDWAGIFLGAAAGTALFSFLIYKLIPIILSLFLNKYEIPKIDYIVIYTILYVIIVFTVIRSDINNELSKLTESYNKKVRKIKADYTKDIEENRKQCNKEVMEAHARNALALSMMKSTTPFSSVASLRADWECVVFEECAHYLKHKSHPATTAAESVKLMGKKAEDYLRQYKEMQYKYEYLLKSFPEIEAYIENDGDLIEVCEKYAYSEIEEHRDRRMDYLTKEEWATLSSWEKSQLSLDRYVASKKKSKWFIGRDYEMSCSWMLMQMGYKIDPQGIKLKFEDLGRDIIATKYSIEKKEYITYIIQCKYWGKDKTIHENVIMQLYGTLVLYKIEHQSKSLFSNNIQGVLMIPKFSVISPLAQKFAEQLNLIIWRADMIDFPRIKCNINAGEKIYHLPFDQQYDRTQIVNKGECYAYRASDAERMGFRRAKRYVE